MTAVSEPALVMDDPEVSATVAVRGALLIDELAGPVKKLGPRIDEMLSLGATLQVWGLKGMNRDVFFSMISSSSNCHSCLPHLTAPAV